MKKQYIAAFACILAAACSKAELNEVAPGPSGESMTLTLPQTKVAVSGDSYQFELDDEITAIASNGSRATLKPNAATSGAHTATNYFTGTFDKPVADGSTISFYYNAKSIADNGTATFEQNGNPWLVSTGNNFTRTEYRQISVTATLAAPENVRAIAVIFTDNEGIESFEFHAKDQSIELGTFDGTSFSGNSTVSQNVLSHQSEGIKFMRSNIVYVPKDMKGGFWIKAIKGQQAMYKSYATKNPIENTTVAIGSFVPAKVDIDVKISGFATSYSYYVANEGIEGISAKDVNKANSVSNDWMGEGKATYTISREGIPAALLTFDSFKLTVDGKEYTGDEATKAISVAAGNGHTTWGQKDIVATVVYKDLDGNEYTGTQTIVRHITGLPYNKDKNSVADFKEDWNTSGGKSKWNDSYLRYGSKCIVTFKGFNIPNGTTVGSTIFYKVITYTSSRFNDNTTTLTGGQSTIFNETVSGTAKTKTFEGSANVNFISSSNNITTTSSASTSSWSVSHSQLHYIGVIYR